MVAEGISSGVRDEPGYSRMLPIVPLQPQLAGLSTRDELKLELVGSGGRLAHPVQDW